MTLSKGSLFDPRLVGDLINKVKGKSSVAVLSGAEPVPFNGLKEFTFTLDNEIDVVAENGAKSHGGISIEPQTIIPIKVEYGARVSDEFMFAAEEEQINILKAFNDGFAKKLARGLDLMSMHGINPRTGTASTVIGTNHFDARVTQTVTYAAAQANANVEAAIALVQGSEGDVTGMAMSPALRSGLAALTNSNGEALFPELAWGASPGSIKGLQVDVNPTVSVGDVDHAIVGDFREMFRWGYAKQIATHIIPYGDPDNSGKDLKGHNQIYIRAEAYLGWGIMDPASFARITVE